MSLILFFGFWIEIMLMGSCPTVAELHHIMFIWSWAFLNILMTHWWSSPLCLVQWDVLSDYAGFLLMVYGSCCWYSDLSLVVWMSHYTMSCFSHNREQSLEQPILQFWHCFMYLVNLFTVKVSISCWKTVPKDSSVTTLVKGTYPFNKNHLDF